MFSVVFAISHKRAYYEGGSKKIDSFASNLIELSFYYQIPINYFLCHIKPSYSWKALIQNGIQEMDSCAQVTIMGQFSLRNAEI